MNGFLLTLSLVLLVLATADAIWHKAIFSALLAAGLAGFVGEVLRVYVSTH